MKIEIQKVDGRWLVNGLTYLQANFGDLKNKNYGT